VVVTFYSYKGGVGRSMALANVAELLSEFGYRVIVCDWDLEAPGLERYFVRNNASDSEYRGRMDDYLSWPGLVDLLVEYKQTLSRPSGDEGVRGRDAYGFAQVGDLWLRRPSSYARTANPDRRVPGSLRLITAGRRFGEHQRQYGDAVRRFDWQQFYEQWAGDAYMDFFRSDLVGEKGSEGAADLLLIDSRTGVTEQGGVCTHHLADLVLVLAAANDLNMEGAKWMVRTLSDPQLVKVRGGRSLGVLPIASRIEQTAQTKELVEFRRQFLREFGPTLAAHTTNPEALAIATEIPYMPYYSYHERVVAREEEGDREQNLYAKYRAIADAIVEYGVRTHLLRERTAEGITAKAADRGRRSDASWDLPHFLEQIKEALAARDTEAVTPLLEALDRELHTRADPFPEEDADDILRTIAHWRQFATVQAAAESFIRAGLNHPNLRLAYARSLIEQGNSTLALSILPALVAETAKEPEINTPARMLIGRIFKDQYIDSPERSTSKAVRSLERAVNEYYGLYRQDPNNIRAAVSLAGLVWRARRDGIELTDAPDAAVLGAAVMNEIQSQRASSVSSLDWVLNGLAVEASLAAGHETAAAASLIDFANDTRVDGFSLAGLRRQLTSVWGLALGTEPGRSMLCVIDSAILHRSAGRVEIESGSLPAVAAATADGHERLSAIFGAQPLRSLQWFQRGLAQSGAVVRIDSDRAASFGTGFLVAGSSLYEPLGPNVVLVTTAHVLSPDPSVADALRPTVATVVRTNLTGGESVHRVGDVLFTSPPDALDVTVAELEPPLTDAPTLTPATASDASDVRRVVLVGHERGKKVAFAEGDLLDRDEAMVHYRAAGEPGSSGSPVFDESWRLIAMHHASKPHGELPWSRAGVSGPIGEGISVAAIARELARTIATPPRTRAQPRPPSRGPARVFVNFVHSDLEFCEQLSRHLSVLQRRGRIELLSGNGLLVGDDWRETPMDQLERADILLALVSAAYLSSEANYLELVPRVMEKATAGAAIVLPVILKTVRWTPPPPLQPLPRNGTPVVLWSNRDAAWTSVVDGVTSALDQLPLRQPG
jgi:hypothetical protein